VPPLEFQIADGIGVELTDLIKKAQASISKKNMEASKGD
jgi:hypothetical protein